MTAKTETQVLLDVREVAHLIGYETPQSIYNLMSRAGLPKPIRVGGRSVRWVRAELDAWIEGKRLERDQLSAALESA